MKFNIVVFRYLPDARVYIVFTLFHIRPHKKNSWLASSPAHKKGPAQDFFYFLFKKNPTFIDQQALIYGYVVFLC
jgi:hypothetical protein